MRYYSENTVRDIIKRVAHTALEQSENFADAILQNQPNIEISEPHGDLIDAHAFAVKVGEAQERIRGKEYDPFMLLGDVLRWIGLEPTVVEASKERE